jgi:hypothetical protein
LRTAEESSSRAVAEIIEGDDDERPSLNRRIFAEGSVGLAMGLASGLIAFGYGWVRHYGPEMSALFGIVTGLSILLTVFFGSVLADAALRRSDRDHSVSATALSVVAMLFAAILYLGLSYLAGFVAQLLMRAGA